MDYEKTQQSPLSVAIEQALQGYRSKPDMEPEEIERMDRILETVAEALVVAPSFPSFLHYLLQQVGEAIGNGADMQTIITLLLQRGFCLALETERVLAHSVTHAAQQADAEEQVEPGKVVLQ